MWPQWPMAWPKIAPSFGRRNSGRIKFYRFSGLSFHIFPKSVEECHKCVSSFWYALTPLLLYIPYASCMECLLYLHLPQKSMSFVGKYSSTMEHLGMDRVFTVCSGSTLLHGDGGSSKPFRTRREKPMVVMCGWYTKTDKQFFPKKMKSQILQ